MPKVMIQFDECKPHWAKQRGYDTAAAACGLQNVTISGDFDAKLAYVGGEVEDFEAFKVKCSESETLREGSVCEVRTSDLSVEAELALLERRIPDAERVRDCAEQVALISFGPPDEVEPPDPNVGKTVYPDCDICSSCRDHSGFTRDADGETVSDCCGASPMDVDCEYDLDR